MGSKRPRPVPPHATVRAPVQAAVRATGPGAYAVTLLLPPGLSAAAADAAADAFRARLRAELAREFGATPVAVRASEPAAGPSARTPTTKPD